MRSILLAGLGAILAVGQIQSAAADETAVIRAHDGSHDFDFLIGDWKAHVRRLPERLVGSSKWVEYDGISKHHKLLDSNANFEEFDVRGSAGRLKAQTLRLYSPKSQQWSIYGIDLDAGSMPMPATIGQFNGKRGEFYDREEWKGRWILVRFVWLDISPKAARMEQSFSDDGGRTWEANWICDLSR